MLRKSLLVAVSLFLLAGCATEFHGEAHLDRKACETKCKSWDMDLYGMVAMGEYSDACVCRKASAPGSQTGAAADEASFLGASASTAAGSAGVVLQARRLRQESTAVGAAAAGSTIPH